MTTYETQMWESQDSDKFLDGKVGRERWWVEIAGADLDSAIGPCQILTGFERRNIGLVGTCEWDKLWIERFIRGIGI